jgi:hypothetical protein
MRESCKYGSVRGAPSNGSPYRDMKRRELITLLGSAAAAWPLAGRAQQANYLTATAVVFEPSRRREFILRAIGGNRPVSMFAGGCDVRLEKASR